LIFSARLELDERATRVLYPACFWTGNPERNTSGWKRTETVI
jgi:hypothetical protein